MFGCVFVAMSGGVDSSVTAHLLKAQGYEVNGIHMELSPNSKVPPKIDHADLERTCQILRIPLHYLHLETEFQSRVIDYFCEEYGLGLTPNPCVRCNKNIKFGFLLQKVAEMGGEFLATGHYARVIRGEAGYKLLKGVDPKKDQSYFLYVLGQKELARVLFPVGGMLKTEVKQLAVEFGLPAASRKESQDACFIPDNKVHSFIASRITSPPGDIVDGEGRILGRHQGLAHYTIGQRQGIGLSSSERMYVVGIEVGTNRLIVGPQSQLYKKKIISRDLAWVSGEAPKGHLEICAKVRYNSTAAKAVLHAVDGKAEISFDVPQKAVAPGQSVVFYHGDEVIGGGIIGETV